MLNDCHTLAQLVEALRYKLEGRGFDSAWCHRGFYWHCASGRTVALEPTQPLTEMSIRNIFFWEVKVAGVDSLEIWEPQPPGNLWAWTGLYRYCLALPCWGSPERLAGVKTRLRADRSRPESLQGQRFYLLHTVQNGSLSHPDSRTMGAAVLSRR